MDVNDIRPPVFELQTSTESVFTHAYVTTMNLPDIQMIDKVPETNTEEVDGLFVVYGLGGILIFFVIYVFVYRYFLYCKDIAQRQEMELRRINERASETSYRRPMNASRIFVEDFNQPGSTSLTLPALAESSCTETKPKYLDVETGKTQDTRIIDLPQIHYRNPQDIPEIKNLSEDNQSPNTTVREISETSGAVSQKTENHDTVGRVESWMSEPPLCFSTPQDSKERIYFPEDFQDLLCPNAEQVQKYESSNERKSDADIATPTKGDEKQSSPTPEEKSRSSPTSPEIVRRRLTKLEDTPQRPSSWQ